VPFALIIVDLDHFKAINDRFGHDAGDKVLVETAQRLRNATREVDCVTRLGGDEFAILLDNASHPGMLDIVCDRVIAALARPIELAGVSYPLSGTIGAAIYPRHGTTQETLYKAADIVLYQAKAAGRNAWRVAHDPGRTVG
jgi:diguanylate cyclase (GGDEF)-like protein